MKNNYWLRSGFFTLSEKMSALVFGFGGGVLLFRILSQTEFGIWVLFLGITSILEVGRIGLLQNGLVKYLSTNENEDEKGRITTASLILNLMLTGLIVLLLYFGGGLIAQWMEVPELEKLLTIYCLTTVLLIPFFQSNYVQQAALDFKGIFWGNFVKGGVLFGYIFWLFISDTKIELVNLAYCQLAAAIAASVVSFLFAKKFLRFSRTIDRAWITKLWNYGIYVFGTNFCTQLFKNVDKFLLKILPTGGLVAVALYEAAIRVTNLTDVPTASMANILFPQSARRSEEGGNAVRDLYEKAVGAILAFMIPAIIFVLIFADWIVFIVSGAEYAEAANVLRITIFFGLFMPYAVQFGTVLDSIGKPNINFYYTLLSLVFTVVFNFIFISIYGVHGAALGTLSAYVCIVVLMLIYLKKNIGVSPFRPFNYMIDFYGQIWNMGNTFRKNGFSMTDKNSVEEEIILTEKKEIREKKKVM